MNVSFLEDGEVSDGPVKWNQISLFENAYSIVKKSFKEAMAEAGVPERGRSHAHEKGS
jgi:hypothetical protein